MSPDRHSQRWLVDVLVLADVGTFLAELHRLTSHMELVVDRLADIVVAEGSPSGHDPDLRAWLICLLADEVERSGRPPAVIDLHELITGVLFDRQAELEACLDPAVGAGVLSRTAAGLLAAMVFPAACRARADGCVPLSWQGLRIFDHELRRLGEALLGVQLDGDAPFRLVCAGDLDPAGLAGSRRIVLHLLELARMTSRSGNHGLVIVPNFDASDEIPEVSGLPESA